MLISSCHALSSVSCVSLVGQSFSNGTAVVVSSEQLASGTNFTGTTAEAGYNAAQVDLPEACRVVLAIQTSDNSSAGAEVWLPVSTAWNSRLLVVGNGGFAGAVNYPDVVWGLRKGFATASTDTGHNSSSSDGSFLLNPVQSVDWGHRALHLSTVAVKQVIAVYYGETASENSHSYYAGCSTGGRQGMNAIQRYPDDFDGALVGSAIPWQTHTSAWQIYVALLQFLPGNVTADVDPYIPSTAWSDIATAVLSQCDGLDGVEDGIIMDPTKCVVDVDVLRCNSSAAATNMTCLSDAQAANLQRMYEPWLSLAGELLNPGISTSGEASFATLMNSAEPQFGPVFYRNGVYNDSAWDFRTLTPRDVAVADAINPGGSNAVDPAAMHAFAARGGRVLQYHGFADPLIPSLNAPVWHETVVDYFRGLGVADAEDKVQDFYRLFMVPGMGHCSGGVGAWVLDGASQSGITPQVEGNATYSMLYSLIDWVEGGAESAPEKVVGTHYVDAGASPLVVQFTRPVCRWPTVAVYDGVGDVDDAGSWSCPVTGTH
jgi:feruloyl esterase